MTIYETRDDGLGMKIILQTEHDTSFGNLEKEGNLGR